MSGQGRHNSRGFSLVEVMVGMAVFMIGMLGVIALQISSTRAGAYSANLSEATALAIARSEELNRLPYSNANLNDTNSPNGTAGLDAVPADYSVAGQGRNGSFTVYWNVAVGAPVANCKTITVIVRWIERNQTREFKTTFFRST